MDTKRAKRGGEVGINGEFYAGGTFLPSTTLGKMEQRARSGSRINARTILTPIKALCSVDNLWNPTKATLTASDCSLAYYGYTREKAQQIVDRFNAGER